MKIYSLLVFFIFFNSTTAPVEEISSSDIKYPEIEAKIKSARGSIIPDTLHNPYGLRIWDKVVPYNDCNELAISKDGYLIFSHDSMALKRYIAFEKYHSKNKTAQQWESFVINYFNLTR